MACLLIKKINPETLEHIQTILEFKPELEKTTTVARYALRVVSEYLKAEAAHKARLEKAS
jgi:hypothetical protein